MQKNEYIHPFPNLIIIISKLNQALDTSYYNVGAWEQEAQWWILPEMMLAVNLYVEAAREGEEWRKGRSHAQKYPSSFPPSTYLPIPHSPPGKLLFILQIPSEMPPTL